MSKHDTRLRRYARLATAAAAVLLASGCARKLAGDPSEPAEKPSEGGQKTAGALLFEQHCARCHGAAGQGTERAPKVVGEGALVRFRTARDLFEFASQHMPQDAPGSLREADYWAIVAFDLRANGVDLDAPLGPDNANGVQLHATSEGAAPAAPDDAGARSE